MAKQVVKREKAGVKGGLSEAELIKKYPNIIAGTLKIDGKAGKRSVEAKLKCGHTERVYTSDLFQVKMCHACRKTEGSKKLEALKARVAAKKAEKKPEKKATAAPAKKAAKAPKAKPSKKAAKPASASPVSDPDGFVGQVSSLVG